MNNLLKKIICFLIGHSHPNVKTVLVDGNFYCQRCKKLLAIIIEITTKKWEDIKWSFR